MVLSKAVHCPSVSHVVPSQFFLNQLNLLRRCGVIAIETRVQLSFVHCQASCHPNLF